MTLRASRFVRPGTPKSTAASVDPTCTPRGSSVEARVGLSAHGVGRCEWMVAGDDAELAGLEVVECLPDFGFGVHDEGAVPGDRFADRLAAQKQDLHAAGAGVLLLGGGDREGVAGT